MRRQFGPARAQEHKVYGYSPVNIKQKFFLFTIFAFYGPSIKIIGEFRVIEILVIIFLVFNLGAALRNLGKYEKRLIGFFLLAALAHIVADIITDASIDGTLKRAGTYIVLSLLLVGLSWLARGNPVRMIWMLAGYCFSYLVVFLFNVETPSRGYLEAPWRLGLGMASTLGVTLFIALLPRYERIGAFALLALGGIHWLLDARTLAALSVATGFLVFWASFRTQPLPSTFRPFAVARFAALAIAGLVCLNYGLELATKHQLFTEQMQKKMEMQLANPYGLIGGGRPEFVVALLAISKSPLWGHGSTNVDPDVYYLYASLSAETYSHLGDYKGFLEQKLAQEWVLGTPSHSHLLGAWADAGVFASLCWFLVIGSCGYVLVRLMLWRHRFMPLVVLIVLATMWDVLFSPGPTRMDMAFRLLVLTFAVNTLRAFDLRLKQNHKAGKSAPPPNPHAGIP